jgi:major vault protein
MMTQLDKIQDKKEILAEIASDEFVRSQTYNTAKTITLDTKFQGAVTIDVWTGYAVLVTGKTGQRKVIVGPQTYLLEYDENLAVIELSTGTPKSDDNTVKTVYLRVLHNKVSDVVRVETKDICPIDITLSYRVNFEGEPDKWFNVENYVKFLTDHLRSKVRNFVQKLTIAEFFANPIDIVRDIILGKIKEDSNRTGGKFNENGMHIYDVEVLNIELLDSEIEELLMQAQHDNVRQKLEIIAQENKFQFTKQSEELNRKIAEEQSITKQKNIELIQQEVEKNLLLTLQKLESEIKAKQKTLTARLDEQKQLTDINDSEIAREKAKREMVIDLAEAELKQTIERMKAEVEAVVHKAEAVSPDLIAALQAFGDKALAEKMAESMAPLSIIGGKSIAEVFANMLKGTVLEKVLEKKN